MNRAVHCIMCAVFSVARAHSHVTSPSKYPHFCLCSLLHVNPVRIRFSHLHVVQRLAYPIGRLSLGLTVTLCGVVCNLRHSLTHMSLGENSAGFILHTKQFLDFSLVSAGCCPYREWASLVSCLVFPFYHIHLPGCRVAQFQLSNTVILHWLVSGILCWLCIYYLVSYLVSGREVISPRLVLRILT